MLGEYGVFAEQYFKMLKMGVPKGGVKQKMRSEGVDPSVLDMDPEKPAPGATAAAAAKPTAPAGPKVIRKRIFWEATTVSNSTHCALPTRAQLSPPVALTVGDGVYGVPW